MHWTYDGDGNHGDVDDDVDDYVDDDRKLTHHMTGLADESPGWCRSSILLVRTL